MSNGKADLKKLNPLCDKDEPEELKGLQMLKLKAFVLCNPVQGHVVPFIN